MTDDLELWIITIVGGIIATVAVTSAWHILHKRIEKDPDYQFDLTRFNERGGQYGNDFVRLQNTGSKSIDACVIYWDDHDCRWWDGAEGPRLIASGGGANAAIPNRSNVNCTVTVKSRDKILRRIKLLDITKAN